jgi:hypothetical protein
MSSSTEFPTLDLRPVEASRPCSLSVSPTAPLSGSQNSAPSTALALDAGGEGGLPLQTPDLFVKFYDKKLIGG